MFQALVVNQITDSSDSNHCHKVKTENILNLHKTTTHIIMPSSVDQVHHASSSVASLLCRTQKLPAFKCGAVIEFHAHPKNADSINFWTY